VTPFALLLPAAGLGARMGARKALLELAGQPLLVHTLRRFLPFRERLCQIIVVAHPDDLALLQERGHSTLRDEKWNVPFSVVAGGARRQDSVRAGLACLRPEAELVAIHDAVRPFVAPEAVAAALDAAEAVGAAIVAAPMKPTVKRAAGGRVLATVDRRDLWCAQTPQVFRRQLILDAYAAADVAQPPSAVPRGAETPRPQFEATDDAQLVERLGRPVAIVPGSDLNLKITTPEDLALAEAILAHGLVPRGNP